MCVCVRAHLCVCSRHLPLPPADPAPPPVPPKMHTPIPTDRMLARLKGLTDPEAKRKAIGAEFIDVFSEYAHTLEGELGHKPRFLVQVRVRVCVGVWASSVGARARRARHLPCAPISSPPRAHTPPQSPTPPLHPPPPPSHAQGTLYPDVIESCPPPGKGQKHSHTIKSHHNVGGLPEDLQFSLIEPLRELFKVCVCVGECARLLLHLRELFKGCVCVWESVRLLCLHPRLRRRRSVRPLASPAPLQRMATHPLTTQPPPPHPQDEVRALGRLLGVPPQFIERHPFPGPGLAVRVIGDVTGESRRARSAPECTHCVARCAGASIAATHPPFTDTPTHTQPPTSTHAHAPTRKHARSCFFRLLQRATRWTCCARLMRCLSTLSGSGGSTTTSGRHLQSSSPCALWVSQRGGGAGSLRASARPVRACTACSRGSGEGRRIRAARRLPAPHNPTHAQTPPTPPHPTHCAARRRAGRPAHPLSRSGTAGGDLVGWHDSRLVPF